MHDRTRIEADSTAIARAVVAQSARRARSRRRLGAVAARRARSLELLGLAAALSFLALLGGCSAPQDPADEPFRTGSIRRHENGRLERAQWLRAGELNGLPCEGWVWWHEDGAVAELQLAADAVVQGHALPAGSLLVFDREGRLAHAALSRTTELEGWPCRGKWKIDTAFHPSGHVKAFFPPDDLEVDGVLCEASLFHPVYLHDGGRLRQCKLARAATVGGRELARGTVVSLDEDGRLVEPR